MLKMLRRPSLRMGLAVLACGCAVCAAESFRPDDLLAVTQVSSIAAAADGTAVAVSLARPDVSSDTLRDEVHIIDRTSREDGPEVLRGVQFLKWTRDGRRLRFMTERDGHVELREYDRSSRTTRTVARLPFAPTYLVWSPGESRVALVAERPAARHDWLVPKDLSPVARKPIIIDHALFRDDDGTWLPATERRLFVMELAGGGEPREVPLPKDVSLGETEGGYGGPPAWSADERALIVSVARGFDARANLWNVNRDLLRIELAGGAHSWLAEEPGIESHPAVSPDGRQLAYLRQRGAPEATVFHRDLVVRAFGSARESAVWTAHDLDVNSFIWATDSQLLARYLDRGRFVLSRVSSKGEERRLTDEVAVDSALTEATRGGAIPFVRTRPDLPPEGVLLDKAGRVAEWTNFNAALRARKLSEVSGIDFRSANVDGRMIHAIVARPRGLGDTSSLPVVVDLHGGPYSARTFNFDTAREIFVGQGYVVVQPNYRGSIGYGSAFSQLSDRRHYPGRFDQPEAPSEMGLDVAGVVKAVAERQLGDPSRVFLRGESAGALLTSWTIGRTREFRAAVANSWYPGEFDGASYGGYQIRRYFNGPPWDPAYLPEYWRRQPLMLADRMVTPLLILQGDRDWITPMGETEKFYYALRSRGLDVVLAVFPDETHVLRRHPESERTSLLMEVEWFRRHDAASPEAR